MDSFFLLCSLAKTTLLGVFIFFLLYFIDVQPWGFCFQADSFSFSTSLQRVIRREVREKDCSIIVIFEKWEEETQNLVAINICSILKTSLHKITLHTYLSSRCLYILPDNKKPTKHPSP